MDKIKLHDKEFRLSITPARIREAVTRIASDINRDMAGKNPLFLCILNGAFIFASDLVRKITMDCEISFVRFSSYRDTSSTGMVSELIGLNEDIKDRTIIVVEDIVDSGTTLDALVDYLSVREPGEVKIAALLLKPGTFRGKVRPDYVGLEVPDEFIVGYGLDYNGLGRNFEGIYKIME